MPDRFSHSAKGGFPTRARLFSGCRRRSTGYAGQGRGPRACRRATIGAAGRGPCSIAQSRRQVAGASFRREFRTYAATHDLKLNELLRLCFEAYRRQQRD